MIWIILAVLLGPAAMLLIIGWLPPVSRLVSKLQQPPPWIRYVMGIKFSPIKGFLFAWICGPIYPVASLIMYARSWLCRHTFDQTYGVRVSDGDLGWHCGKCFKWRDHSGFLE